MTEVRAAVHVHSDWSFDGHRSLAAVAAAFRRRGYGAVLMAEHCQSLDATSWQDYRSACAAVSSPDLLVVPGVEYRDADNVVHVPTWGDLPHLGDGLDIATLLAEVGRRGGAAIWAHPARRDAHRVLEESVAPLVHGIEVWNRKYDGWRPSAVGADLARRWGLPGLASLDFHRSRQFFPLATVLDVSTVTEEGVVEALRAGRVEARFVRRPVTAWSRGVPLTALSAADAGRAAAASGARRAARAVRP